MRSGRGGVLRSAQREVVAPALIDSAGSLDSRQACHRRRRISIPAGSPSELGAAGASCTSASRSTMTGFLALITPDERIDTVITADVYGTGDADRMLGRAIAGRARDEMCVVGAVGHDFYEGERNGPKGFPRFTDPALRGPHAYADYLRMATERSLERCGIDRFDLLLLHNPDRTGYTSDAVWNGMAALRDAGLTRLIGVAPGPANGFTLDVIDCLERFGALIDWAMIILNPLEPWPGELCLGAAAAAGVRSSPASSTTAGCSSTTWCPVQELVRGDHRGFRPAGWIEAGRERLDGMRPIAERAGLTMIQLACQWNLAHEPVACVVPTLIQEAGPAARTDRGQARRTGRRCRLSSASATPTSTRSGVSATTRAAWRSRAPRPSTPARTSRIAGRSTSACGTSPSAGASIPSGISLSGWRRDRAGGRPAADRRLQLRRRPLRGQRAVRVGGLLPLHPLSAPHRRRGVGQRRGRPGRLPDHPGARIACAPGSRSQGPRSSSAATAARRCSAPPAMTRPLSACGSARSTAIPASARPPISSSPTPPPGSRSRTTGCRATRRAGGPARRRPAARASADQPRRRPARRASTRSRPTGPPLPSRRRR